MNTKQLRQKILDLAIRGKLVLQDPNDEPASVLVEKIRVEKERLIKEKKIKRDKNESFISRGEDKFHYEQFADGTVKRIEDEIPFEIPDNWVWCRVKNIFEINPRNTIDDEVITSFIPMACISDGFSNNYTCQIRKWGDIKKGFTHFQEGDIGIAKITPCFENRKSVVFRALENGYGAGTTELHVLRSILKEISFQYALWFVKTQDFINEGIQSFSGAVGQQRISKEFIEETYFPLPPLSEQYRIVSEIERLFSLIDVVDENKLSLERFIKQTKSKVLDFAIQGKLVLQDPNDESASVLLEKIKNEQKKTGKKIEKIGDNSHYKPFEIPESWVWCKLEYIGNWASGSTPSRSNRKYYQNGTIPWLKTGDLNDNIIEETTEKITEIALKENSMRLNPIGTVLIAMYGATIGKLGLLNIEATTNQACCACIPHEIVSNRYLFYYLKSQKENLQEKAEGGTQPNISKDKIMKYPISIPPLEEQKRIVNQIETIFKTLDSIQNNL
ncbi:hypothetical protein EZS27_012855 [termite gut metagenome]|uniref:Type I restriction modification DNA specificity domain-containing protein n=1 Tax=termite gut metagenome TaxID=433724 RepID=A0A5J4S1Q3_9ZZZZ